MKQTLQKKLLYRKPEYVSIPFLVTINGICHVGGYDFDLDKQNILVVIYDWKIP